MKDPTSTAQTVMHYCFNSGDIRWASFRNPQKGSNLSSCIGNMKDLTPMAPRDGSSNPSASMRKSATRVRATIRLSVRWDATCAGCYFECSNREGRMRLGNLRHSKIARNRLKIPAGCSGLSNCIGTMKNLTPRVYIIP